jgi:hypothetical protein
MTNEHENIPPPDGPPERQAPATPDLNAALAPGDDEAAAAERVRNIGRLKNAERDLTIVLEMHAAKLRRMLDEGKTSSETSALSREIGGEVIAIQRIKEMQDYDASRSPAPQQSETASEERNRVRAQYARDKRQLERAEALRRGDGGASPQEDLP